MGCCFNNLKKKKYTPSNEQNQELHSPKIEKKSMQKIKEDELEPSSEENQVEVIVVIEEESIERIPSPKKINDKFESNWVEGEQLGQGAFGRVIMGMNKSTGVVMAVKQVYLQNMKEDDERIRQLKIEIEMLSKLQHPNIVRYLGCETTTQHLNIFLEYVGGGSVHSMLKKFGKFRESLIKVYLKQILLGLSFLHSRGIIHRDIKGANILIDNTGKPKLADFGSSKQLNDLMHESVGSLCGTPNYMAPEVINQESYGSKADIWSLGCTIIEMACGNPPYSEYQNAITVMIQIGKAQNPPPIPENIKSKEGRDFISKCLKIKPSERATVDELLQHPFLEIKSIQGSNSFDLQEWNEKKKNKGTKIRERKEDYIQQGLIPKATQIDSKYTQSFLINNQNLDSDEALDTYPQYEQGQGRQIEFQSEPKTKTNQIKVRTKNKEERKSQIGYKIEIEKSEVEVDHQQFTSGSNQELTHKLLQDQFFQQQSLGRMNLQEALNAIIENNYSTSIKKQNQQLNTLDQDLDQVLNEQFY